EEARPDQPRSDRSAFCLAQGCLIARETIAALRKDVTAKCVACPDGSEAGRSPTPGAAIPAFGGPRHHAQEEAAGEAEEGQGADAGAPLAARPRGGGEECEHLAGRVYRGVADGGGVGCASRHSVAYYRRSTRSRHWRRILSGERAYRWMGVAPMRTVVEIAKAPK